MADPRPPSGTFAAMPAPGPTDPPVLVPVEPPSFARPVALLPTGGDARGVGADVSRGGLLGLTLYGLLAGLVNLLQLVGASPQFLGRYGNHIAAIAAGSGGLLAAWLSNRTPPPPAALPPGDAPHRLH